MGKLIFFLVIILFLNSCTEKKTYIITSPENNPININGKVLDKKTNIGIAYATIKTTPFTDIILTDEEGNFLIPSVKKQDYLIEVEADNYYDSYIAIKANSENTMAVLSLNPEIKENKAPSKPFIYEVMNLKTDNIIQTQIKWNSDDEEENFMLYDVFIDTKNPPINIYAKDVIENSFRFNKIEGSDKLFFKVIAKDRQGAISSSHIFEFDNSQYFNYNKLENEIFSFPFDKDNFYFNTLDFNKTELDSNYVFATNRFNEEGKSFKIEQYTPHPNFVPYNISNDKEFTISFWIKANLNYFGTIGASYTNLLSQFRTGNEFNSFAFQLDNEGKVNFVISELYNGEVLKLKGKKPINNNLWNHISLVKNDNIYMFYLNGILQSEGNYNKLSLNVTNLYFGSNDAITTSFAGFLDDFIYFNKAFKRSEILELFNN